MHAKPPSDRSSTSTTGSPLLPHVTLEIVRGQAREKVRHVTTPAFLIGSAPDCDLVLGDPRFPQVYAYLIVHTGGVLVRHLGFEPELTVNGQEASRVALRDGDRLRLGPYEFVVGIERRRVDPEQGRSSFGSVPLGALGRFAHESEAEVLASVTQLLTDVREAVGTAPRAIPLRTDGRAQRATSGAGLAAS